MHKSEQSPAMGQPTKAMAIKSALPCDAELWVMAGKYPSIPAQQFIDAARDVLNKFGAGQAAAPVSAEPVAASYGYKLVPIEPTVTMRIMGGSAAVQSGGSWGDVAVQAYKAMLGAAPVAAQAQQESQNGTHTPPFSNCSFRLCDLPGQCRGEGKCHHPAMIPVPAQAQQPVSGADGLPPVPSAYNERGSYVGYSKSDLISYARAALAQQEADKVDAIQALNLVRMSAGWRYMSAETQKIVDAAINAASKEQT